jgi:hypothetical protein
MEWVLGLVSLLLFLLVAGPIAIYLGAIVLLWASSLFAGPAPLRAGFYCPFTKRRVTADFLTESGSDRPSDVLSCSAFPNPHDVRCKKGCLALATTRSVSAPLLPRYSLIAGGTAYRASAMEAHGGGQPGGGDLHRVA